jgi:hypothetical protein
LQAIFKEVFMGIFFSRLSVGIVYEHITSVLIEITKKYFMVMGT